MKKLLFLICLIISMCIFCSCSSNEEKTTSIGTSETSNLNLENSSNYYPKIIYDEKHYKIIENGFFDYCYYIYDLDKDVVFMKENLNKVPSIEFANNEIIDVHIGFGTGLIQHQYYSITRDCMSRQFFYVSASYNELIAYLYVPDENSFENRKLIIRNIFDKNDFYKEVYLGFSSIITPIIDAEFINDGKQLQITYLTGESETEVHETLDIM